MRLRRGWWILLWLVWPTITDAAVKAFPTAEGFGANAVGGRGGLVIEVTNLDDSGPGSLRNCVENTGPRTCIFRVGGTITLNSALRASGPQASYLTIAGQTAPGDGIQLKNWGLGVTYGAHDVIIRHIRIRPGSDANPAINVCDGLVIYSPSELTYNVIADHVSVEWGCDDTVNVDGNIKDITIQWSLVGEGLSEYLANDYANAMSKGLIFGDGASTATLSVHHNAFIHMGDRTPNAQMGTLLDWRNNLVYNWYACQTAVQLGDRDGRGTLNINMVGNHYIAGPNTSPGCVLGVVHVGSGGNRVYIQDNKTPYCSTCSTLADLGFVDGVTFAQPLSDNPFRVFAPFDAPTITISPVATIESLLVPTVGASRPLRDALDTRLINELTSRTGDIGRRGVPYPTLASGTPPTDTDHDGIPDAWETAHGLNLNNASDGPATATNGYTNLENYLNELAGDGVTEPPPTPVDLVAEYKFDENTGTVAADSSGQGHDCTMTSAGWGAPIIGVSSFSTNGTRKCSTALVTATRPSPVVGLSAWWKGSIAPEDCDVISLGDSVVLRIKPNHSLEAVTYDGTNWFVAGSAATAIHDGNAHLVSTTKDSTGIRVWFDSAQVSFTPTTGSIDYTLGSSLVIGQHGSGASGYSCTGLIDNVRVFDTALTQTAVENIYAESVPMPGVAFEVTHQAWYMANAAQGSQLGSLDANIGLTLPVVAGMRWALHNNDTPVTEYFRTYCRQNTGGGYGAWSELGNSYGALDMRYLADSVITQGEATGQLLPLGGYTGVAGKVLENPVDLTSPYDAGQKLTIGTGEHAELEVRVEVQVAGDYQCRPYREDGSDFGAGYANIVTMTAAEAMPVAGVEGVSLQGVKIGP